MSIFSIKLNQKYIVFIKKIDSMDSIDSDAEPVYEQVITTLCLNAYTEECKENNMRIPNVHPIFVRNFILELLNKLRRNHFTINHVYFKYTKDEYDFITTKLTYYVYLVDENIDELIEMRIRDIKENPSKRYNKYRRQSDDILRQEMIVNNGAEVHFMVRTECHRDNHFGLELEYHNQHSHRLYYELYKQYKRIC